MTDAQLIARLRAHRYNTWKDDLGPEPDKKLAADRIEELKAELEKLERWQAAAFIAHSNLDLDIEANPEAIAELKGNTP